MHKNIKQNDYSRYAANRDVISLFSGAMGLDIGLGKAGLNISLLGAIAFYTDLTSFPNGADMFLHIF